MGMDIHTFIEVVSEDFVWGYAEVMVGRHSDLFQIIRKSQPKGLPDKISYTVQGRHFVMVADPEKEQSWVGVEYVTRAKAEAWIAKGRSYYYEDEHSKDSWVSWPDWWDPSWLTLEEVEEVLHKYMGCEHQNFEFLVLVDTMRSLEKHMGEGKSRLVLWFDI